MNSHQRGSALLLVLWSIITMSVAVLGVVEYIHYNLDETQGLNLNFELRQIAQSGIAVAFSPDISEGDPLLQGDFGSNGGRYEVVLHSETARLNINQILLHGHDDILQRLFVVWGAPSSDARFAVAKLILWAGRTGDAADNYDLERPFSSVEQMRDVEGMDKIEKLHPDWMSAFTIWGKGQLDVNDASADILQAFFGIGERKAESFVQFRSGPDKKEHTLDDQPYTMQLLPGALGFTAKQFEPYGKLVSDKTKLTRAESTAFLNERKRQIRVIFDRDAQPHPVIYQWQEVPL